MVADILFISCDRCGARTSQDEIYLDSDENTICINCHNLRVYTKGYWDGFTRGMVISTIILVIVAAIFFGVNRWLL